MKHALFALAFLVLGAAGARAAALWTFDAPGLPYRICIQNDPENGTVPVVIVPHAKPDAASELAGAQPVQWTERGRVSNAAALALYNAIVIHEDGQRPAPFPQTLPRFDAGPETP